MRLNRLAISLLFCSTGLLTVAGQAPAATHRIEIISQRFSYQPDQITLKKGQPVTLALTTEDVSHGLAIKELGVKLTAKKGHTEQVTFTPDKAGEFEGKCSVFCGVHHGSMRMKVVVTD
ncbi:MAG: cupredoxin domain-containing protein [Acidobacteriaceae bacterium]